MFNRLWLVFQLVGTLIILAYVPGNVEKLMGFVLLWVVTFKSLTIRELVFYVGVCVFFTVMNIMSLKQGIFTFHNADIWGMPYFELVMWGFYLLHTARMLKGPVPYAQYKQVGVLALLYSLAFSVVSDQVLLQYVTAGLLTICLILYHEKYDVLYVGYMVLLGGLIEYTGVWTGQWGYPGGGIGGVPLWFVTLWGGVGFFLRRLMLPMLRGGFCGGQLFSDTNK